MTFPLNRRKFLQTAASTASLARWSSRGVAAEPGDSFVFVLLGDLHYDKLEHHDWGWIERHKPGDASQIKNYSRITAELTPRLLGAVRETISEFNRAPETQVAFVLQVGDLVEGLCGSAELAARQNAEALAAVDGAQLGAPLIFCKGNHDVTGDGAVRAFQGVFEPYLTKQAAALGSARPDGARYVVGRGDSQFFFFDAYDRESLDWLEAALKRRTARRCFVVVHPPVVPYGARATWHVFSGEKDRARREKLLGLLGDARALVLGGHLHKFNTLARKTPNGGRFAQLGVSSVIGVAHPATRFALAGVEAYNGDQIRVEPDYSPETASARRAVYAAELPFVAAFEYADHPGYAVVRVAPNRVTLTLYSGVTRDAWKTVELETLLG